MNHIENLICIAVIMTLLDAVYLTALTSNFEAQVKLVQNAPLKFNIVGAVLCYIFLVCGLYYFIIKDKRPVSDAVILGLVIYGVYETTTYTLFKDWHFYNVVLDTVWGGILFGLVTKLVYEYQIWRKLD
jgi:uncharacterized membrane protein